LKLFVCLFFLHRQNATIQSIFTSLQVRSIVAQKYINFYGLRNFGKIGDKLVTAQIYVHSKVMIADDLAVIGSANINSRSLTGDGDTEIAVVVHNGEFCVNLVQQLLSEHTGKLFLDNRIHQFMMGTLYHVAARNTAAYEKVFGYSVASYAKDAKSYLATVRDLVADDDDNELQSLSGHIVMFPRDFLAGYVAPSKLNRLNPVRKIRRNITG
jgi:phosphatidylserine/phosphatidylglycerophosphate/cardiolipin synthase-like enzyme